MTDPTREFAELQGRSERWKLVAITSWLLLGLLALGAASIAVQSHLEARRARRQVEAAVQAAEDSLLEAVRLRDLETLSRAERQLREAEEPPPGPGK